MEALERYVATFFSPSDDSLSPDDIADDSDAVEVLAYKKVAREVHPVAASLPEDFRVVRRRPEGPHDRTTGAIAHGIAQGIVVHITNDDPVSISLPVSTLIPHSTKLMKRDEPEATSESDAPAEASIPALAPVATVPVVNVLRTVE
jgi:hypothetical protein